LPCTTADFVHRRTAAAGHGAKRRGGVARVAGADGSRHCEPPTVGGRGAATPHRAAASPPLRCCAASGRSSVPRSTTAYARRRAAAGASGGRLDFGQAGVGVWGAGSAGSRRCETTPRHCAPPPPLLRSVRPELCAAQHDGLRPSARGRRGLQRPPGRRAGRSGGSRSCEAAPIHR